MSMDSWFILSSLKVQYSNSEYLFIIFNFFQPFLGDGYIDSDKKLNAIFDAIQAAL